MIFAKKNKLNLLKSFLIVGFVYFFGLMFKITLEYIPLDKNVSFLMIKQTEVGERPEYLWLFYTHVYTSIFVMIAGFFAILRKDFGIRNLHKNVGKLYLFLLLLFSAPSGIYMGFYANGGFFSKFSFVILGFFWWFSSYKAYKYAKIKQFSLHKQWMWRSFALTLSALTLRMWKVFIVYLFHPNPLDVYQIIAWLGWVPNILLIEYLIRKKHL
ncbi:DUF2306 domain-containing protein [Chryseobacterium sp.]|uniref:DUF2306 domain-containing protein n=1 Tax=Chryseobacterium sp. TaxID=1871047 RepID=UPI00388F89EC